MRLSLRLRLRQRMAELLQLRRGPSPGATLAPESRQPPLPASGAQPPPGDAAFVAMLAHQLRTPLTSLRLQTEWLAGAGDEDDRRAACAQLLGSVDELSHLIDQLAMLARAEGRPAPPPAGPPVALMAVWITVMTKLQEQAAEKDLLLHCSVGELALPWPEPVVGQVLHSLLHNAVRYAPPGGHVQVSAARQAGCTCLHVDDSGPGIAAAQRARAFDRFERLGRQCPIGAGLGLSIAKAWVERQGGSIELAASALGGLRVTIVVPDPLPPADKRELSNRT